MEYRWVKKPLVIEAFQLGIDPIPDWFMDRVSDNSIVLKGEWKKLNSCRIHTLEGWVQAKRGTFIVKGVQDEIYPCKEEIFRATYDPYLRDEKSGSQEEE